MRWVTLVLSLGNLAAAVVSVHVELCWVAAACGVAAGASGCFFTVQGLLGRPECS